MSGVAIVAACIVFLVAFAIVVSIGNALNG